MSPLNGLLLLPLLGVEPVREAHETQFCGGKPCVGVLFAPAGSHVGGLAVPTAVRLACGRRLCSVYGEVVPCSREVKVHALPLGLAVSLPAPLAGEALAPPSRNESAPTPADGGGGAVSCSPLWSRPDPVGRLARSLQIVLWVREPVSRIVACWNALFGYDARSPDHAAERRRAEGAAARYLARARSRLESAGEEASLAELSDLEAVVSRAATRGGTAAAAAVALRAALDGVPSARFGLARLVGGVRGLRSLEGQLLFVGVAEDAEWSWNGLLRALSRMLDGERHAALWAAREGASRAPPSLGAGASDALARALSAGALALMRSALAEDDLLCLDALAARGLLPPGYAASARNGTLVSAYRYAAPLRSEPRARRASDEGDGSRGIDAGRARGAVQPEPHSLVGIPSVGPRRGAVPMTWRPPPLSLLKRLRKGGGGEWRPPIRPGLRRGAAARAPILATA